MPITDKISEFLQESGYTNYCFVSYAYPGNDTHPMTKFARRMQQKIEEALVMRVNKPRVFLYNKHILPGETVDWELKENLEGSLTMIAILSQIYFTKDHPWCGKEWAAMDLLWTARSGNNQKNSKVQPIIPVLLHQDIELPPEVKAKSYIDVSKNFSSSRDCFELKDVKDKLEVIIQRIVQVAELVYKKRYTAKVNDFCWPEESPFGHQEIEAPPPPLRKGKKTKATMENTKAKAMAAANNGK